jgi:hypothetical protein
MGAALSQLELLDHPGRSHRPLRDDRTDRTQTVLLRAALSELQRLESLPAGPLHLSLSDLLWLPAHALCLLYYSSPQSCTVKAARLRVSTRWSTSSLSLSHLFWLLAHAPCLLYYNSPQSCTVRVATLRVRHFPPKPLEELHRCSPSVCDHFVRDSARVPLLLPLTVTIQHRLLPRANVS